MSAGSGEKMREAKTVIKSSRESFSQTTQNSHSSWTNRRCFTKNVQFSWDHRLNRSGFHFAARNKSLLKISEKIDVCYLRLWRIHIKWLINKKIKQCQNEWIFRSHSLWRFSRHARFVDYLLGWINVWTVGEEEKRNILEKILCKDLLKSLLKRLSKVNQ